MNLRSTPLSRCGFYLALLASAAGTTHAQEVRGRVVDANGKPVALAQIYLLPSGPTTTSDFSGAFLLKGVSVGANYLAIRRLGYRPDTVAVQVPQRDSILTFRLTTIPATLQPVTTRALQQDLPRLFHRMKVHLGGVAFGTDLRKQYPHMDVGDVIKFDWDLRRYAYARFPYCPPDVYIDGVLMDTTVSTHIADFVPLRDVAAIESFRDPAFIHEPFIAGHNPPGACTPIILIWTKGFKQHPWGG
jgi:hypothetical protein